MCMSLPVQMGCTFVGLLHSIFKSARQGFSQWFAIVQHDVHVTRYRASVVPSLRRWWQKSSNGVFDCSLQSFVELTCWPIFSLFYSIVKWYITFWIYTYYSGTLQRMLPNVTGLFLFPCWRYWIQVSSVSCWHFLITYLCTSAWLEVSADYGSWSHRLNSPTCYKNLIASATYLDKWLAAESSGHLWTICVMCCYFPAPIWQTILSVVGNTFLGRNQVLSVKYSNFFHLNRIHLSYSTYVWLHGYTVWMPTFKITWVKNYSINYTYM